MLDLIEQVQGGVCVQPTHGVAVFGSADANPSRVQLAGWSDGAAVGDGRLPGDRTALPENRRLYAEM